MKRIIKEPTIEQKKALLSRKSIGRTFFAEVKIQNKFVREYQKKYPTLTTTMCYKLSEIDPTYAGGDYVGSYLDWIIHTVTAFIQDDLVPSYEYFAQSELSDEMATMLSAFEKMKAQRADDYLEYGYDIQDYGFFELQDLVSRFLRSNTKSKIGSSDYEIVYQDSDTRIEKVYNHHAGCRLGYYTKWCITKDASFYGDIVEYYKQGFRVYFVHRLHFPNKAVNAQGQVMFPKAHSVWCIILDDVNMPIEAVDENNDDVWNRNTQKDVEYYIELIREIDE